MTANCCTNGRPTLPKLAGQLHHSRSQNFCLSCNPSVTAPNEKLPFVIPSRRRRRGTSYLVTRNQTCVCINQLRGPSRSLGMTRGRLLSSYENFHAVDVRLQHFQFRRKHNKIGILANCDFTFVGQASL